MYKDWQRYKDDFHTRMKKGNMGAVFSTDNDARFVYLWWIWIDTTVYEAANENIPCQVIDIQRSKEQ